MKKIYRSKRSSLRVRKPFTAKARANVRRTDWSFQVCVRSSNCVAEIGKCIAICGAITKSAPTPENAPVGGETVYGLTKVDQERLVLLWGKQIGIPTVALRYSCTYGPRQSIFNPYTGVIAIFCTRLLNNLPPVLYEDGEQTRDFSFVEDIARGNLLAAETDKLDGLPVNIGSARGTPIREIAEQLADILKIDIAPEIERRISPRRNAPPHK